MELFEASAQWSSRPEDQRFANLKEAYDQSVAYAKIASEKKDVNPATLRVEAEGNEVYLLGKGDIRARLTNWAFGQLAARASSPAGFLRELPATLAAQVLNNRLKEKYGTVEQPKDADQTVNILAHAKNDELLVRAFTTEDYTRIWNHELLGRLVEFEQYGWRTPIPFENNTLAWNSCELCKHSQENAAMQVHVVDGKRMHWISDGDGCAHCGVDIRPNGDSWVHVNGLVGCGPKTTSATPKNKRVECANQQQPTIYVSDHDMFVFLTNPNYRLEVKGGIKNNSLQRGFFMENSEVGAKKWKIRTFYYADMCSNHCVWGAENVIDLGYRHVGSVDERVSGVIDRFQVEIIKWANSSPEQEEAKIANAMTKYIDGDREKVIDKVFKALRGDGVSKTIITEAFDNGSKIADIDGSPKTPWGMMNALTRESQKVKFADKRNEIDKAAGRLIDLAF